MPKTKETTSKVVEQLDRQSHQLVVRADCLQIDSNERAQEAANLILVIASMKDEVEKTFSPIVKKAYEAHKAATAARKTHLEPLLAAEARLKQGIKIFTIAENKRRQEALEAQQQAEEEYAEKVAKAKRPERVKKPEALQVEIKPPAELNGATTRKVWRWELLDLTKVPRQYLQLNTTLLNLTVRQQKGSCVIPGIRVFEDVDVARR